MSKPTNFDTREALDVIWNALHGYRETCLPEGEAAYDDEWNDICTAMAWVSEALGHDEAEQ